VAIKSNEVETAFEIVLEEIEDSIVSINQEISISSSSRDYDKSLILIKVAQQMTAFRDKVYELQKEWSKLTDTKFRGEIKTTKTKRRGKRRLSKGLRTREDVFEIPILRAIVKLDGTAIMSDILEEIAESMSSLLNNYAYSLLPSTELPRWQNTAQWARYEMVKKGLLESNSPRGIWSITQLGRDFLKTHTSEINNKLPRPVSRLEERGGESAPLGLVQVIEVCQEIYQHHINYNEAVKIVARRRNLKSIQTIYDKCTRRIGINTDQFRLLLQEKNQLRKYLISQYPDYESYIVSALE